MLPSMEDVSNIQIVREVIFTVLGQVHDEVGLEVDLLVTVGQGLVPVHPLVPVPVHGGLVWELNLAQQVLD